MSDKLHQTKGIVLRNVKYGETSIIVTMLTATFGMQSYIINGVRSSSKSAAGKASYFQPGSILDMVAYHSDLKQLQRLKEYRWAHLYKELLQDVEKNTVMLFMIELLTRCMKQTEENTELFDFVEDALLHLDEVPKKDLALFPSFFGIQLTYFFGIPPQAATGNLLKEQTLYFDLREGVFSNHIPDHPHYLVQEEARAINELLRVRHPAELSDFQWLPSLRTKIIAAIEAYFILHLPDFGTLKSLPVLRGILR